MPAFAGMTPSMFIYEFSHSLIRRNDDIRSKLRGIEPSAINRMDV